MTDNNNLYQEVILDHYKNPRNSRIIEDCTNHAEGHNPLCGDEIELYVTFEGNIVKDIAFKGAGCAISQASASMMTEALKGKTIEQCNQLFDSVHGMFTKDSLRNKDDFSKLGKLTVLSGVSNYPMRVKCASLAWHTFQAALKKDENKQISTE